MTDDHAGHRKRLRARFLQAGSLASFDETDVLELLLFYSIPRSDTRPVAERLLREFGSLKEVLEAPYDKLIALPGVGEATAQLLKLTPAIAKAYFGSEAKKEIHLPDAGSIRAYLAPLFFGVPEERLYALALDNRGLLLGTRQISGGDRRRTAADPDDIMNALCGMRACAAVLAHNHPVGLCVPSREDTQVTETIAQRCRDAGIRLLDHLIFGEKDVFSFAQSPKWKFLFYPDPDEGGQTS